MSMDVDNLEVREELTPIAKVNLVSEASPAFHAVSYRQLNHVSDGYREEDRRWV